MLSDICIFLFFDLGENEVSPGKGENFRESLEHSMNPELQKVRQNILAGAILFITRFLGFSTF